MARKVATYTPAATIHRSKCQDGSLEANFQIDLLSKGCLSPPVYFSQGKKWFVLSRYIRSLLRKHCYPIQLLNHPTKRKKMPKEEILKKKKKDIQNPSKLE